MNGTSVGLLRAAADLVGGGKALAERLGIGEAQLAKFMSEGLELPDGLRLRAVDIILADVQSRIAAARGR